MTMQGKSTDSSPEIKRQQSTDLVDTFGSVATVRGTHYSIYVGIFDFCNIFKLFVFRKPLKEYLYKQ